MHGLDVTVTRYERSGLLGKEICLPAFGGIFGKVGCRRNRKNRSHLVGLNGVLKRFVEVGIVEEGG